MLIGYFEDISSDRALERMIQIRLDLRYFIGHDMGERAISERVNVCSASKRLNRDSGWDGQQYYGLRWINTRGLKSAGKVMLMAAAAFNLKKWVKHLIENNIFTNLWKQIGCDGSRSVSLAYLCFRIIFGDLFLRTVKV